MARMRDPAHGLAVLYVDLDGFKPVNDAHRHQLGDHLLVAVAQSIAAAVRPQDIVGRVGGDEFVVLLQDLTEKDALEVAGRIQRAVAGPHDVGGQMVHRGGVRIGPARAADGAARRR